MSPQSISYSEALRLIWERSSYDRGYISNPFSQDAGPELGLCRTRAMLDALGSPDRCCPIVHVAGTKGKGSTCACVAAIGQAAGYRTGLYSSPHLHSFRERIAIDGKPIDEREFAALTQSAIVAVEQLESAHPELGQVTAFELLTAMSLLAFADAECDLAVIEVGLGGTFDATNVIDPAVSVITRLDLEHTLVLGDTIAEIAANKAGIIKLGVPVISAPQECEAIAVIDKAATSLDAPYLLGGRDFRWSGSWRDFTWNDGDRSFAGLSTGMAGDHQMENAALAIAAWRQLERAGLFAAEDAIRQGLASASLPGRFEQVTVAGQRWMLDGAHTPVAATVLANTLLEETGHSITVIAGFLRDKHPRAFLEALAPAVSQLIVTAPSNPRALPVDDLAPIAHAVDSQAIVRRNLDDSMHLARTLGESAVPILITGSLTLVAEARVLLGLARNDPTPTVSDVSEKLRSIAIG